MRNKRTYTRYVCLSCSPFTSGYHIPQCAYSCICVSKRMSTEITLISAIYQLVAFLTIFKSAVCELSRLFPCSPWVHGGWTTLVCTITPYSEINGQNSVDRCIGLGEDPRTQLRRAVSLRLSGTRRIVTKPSI